MIKIGKEVYNLLSTHKELTDLVGNKIYPLISDISTTFPFVVFRKDNYTPTYTKDGISSKSARIEIIVASDKYDNSVDVAEEVLNAISKNRKYRLEVNTEDYIEDTFIQNLIFNIEK